MKIDHPVALAHTVTDLLARRRDQTDAFVRVEHVVGDRAANRRVDAKGAIARLHCGAGALAQRGA